MAGQCTAKAHSTGKRCSRSAIAGGTVCRVHGGAAPQVVRSARERLAALVCPAITVFEERLADKELPQLQVQVAKDILDRTGHKATDKFELSGPDGGPISVDFTRLTDEQVGTLTALLKLATPST
jgi:hypothetical protein